jgi:hypothetical protein
VATRTNLAPIKPIRFEYADEVSCPRCDELLERHQPEAARPERLLGICHCCSRWFLIDEQWCLLYPLPEVWRGSEADN